MSAANIAAMTAATIAQRNAIIASQMAANNALRAVNTCRSSNCDGSHEACGVTLPDALLIAASVFMCGVVVFLFLGVI